jgi:inorganic pyrophosphatase
MMGMDDDGEQDDKVLAVPSEDPRYDHVEDLGDVTAQQRAEIEEFFATYKNLEAGKEVETLGWEGRDAALDAIEHALSLYEEQFG